MENFEKLDTFYKKNDIGVNIEYTIIGFYKVNGNYMIYTDFTTDHSNKLGIKIYVDKETKLPIQVIEQFDNGEYITYFTYEFGIVTDVRLLQRENAPSPIVVMFLGISIEDSASQL